MTTDPSEDEIGPPSTEDGEPESPEPSQVSDPLFGLRDSILAAAQAVRPSWQVPVVDVSAFTALKDMAAAVVEQQREPLRRLQEQLNRSLQPLIDLDPFRQLERRMLPPNLRERSAEIRPTDVYNFLREEGIPLFIVPRADVGVRLLRAPDHSARRKVLNDRFNAILADCTSVIESSAHPIVQTEVYFAHDGLNALRGGNYLAAQALFTVLLDTLIIRFQPDRDSRKKITNRATDADVPTLIEDMGLEEAYVWLPIWNSHGQFWRDRGDQVPRDYSRHATVHGVSRAQYSKRNCIQSLMLVSMLIGYANGLAGGDPDSR